MTGLVDVDGTVRVPPQLANTVFCALLLYAGTRSRTNGGALSPDAERLLMALHRAAEQPSSGHGTADDEPDSVSSGSGTVFGIGQAAALLGCSPEYVRRLARTGRIPAQRVGAVWLIDAAALEDYRHGRTEEPGHGIAGPAQAAEAGGHAR